MTIIMIGIMMRQWRLMISFCICLC
jgi:hypothetical protein